MPTLKLTAAIITAAIEGFESQKRRIDDQIAELRAMLPGGPGQDATTPAAPGRKRRKFSAAARRRMKEAQKRRWAKIRRESEPPAPASPEPAKPKRRISKEGMARIIAAPRNVKAAKAQQQKTGRKRAAGKKAAVMAARGKGGHEVGVHSEDK